MKHAVIAGFGPGMGAALARRFAREGFALSLLARGREALERAETEFSSHGAVARGYPVDLADPAAIAAAMKVALAASGTAEIMIYNAARWREAASMALPPEDFASDLSLAVTGALACAQAVHPAMKRRGGGTILFTGGGLALHPEHGAGVASLAAGKAALRGLAHALARELSADGVHVATVTIAGAVAPGTAFDPDVIAEHYWELHAQPRDAWEVERVFRG